MKYTNALILICMAFVGFTFLNMREMKTDIEGYNEKIDNLTKEIDSVQQLNQELDDRIASLHSELELIDSDIDRVQNGITNIRKNTDEKVNSVDMLTFNELVKFFTDRYGERLGGEVGSSDSETRN
jgi:septal ring factor EnvC (AmiA/AmiB activator)